MFSIRRVGAVAAACVWLAACGSQSSPKGSVTIAARTTSVGSVVVDASGRTLYRFDHDTAGAGTSACNGACAKTWPAELVTGTPSAAGVAGSLGVITRSDGSRQVTLDGHPLYHFSGDQAAGDTNGNGFGGIWHVVPASGGATGAGTSTSRGPYGY